MATGEQWHSRDSEYSRGPEGMQQTMTYYYDVDDADLELWMPPEEQKATFRGVDMWLTGIRIRRHDKGTKATVEVVYSTDGIEKESDIEVFFTPIGGTERFLKYCPAQHQHEFEVPSRDMIYGITRWEKSLPAGALSYVGSVHNNNFGPFIKDTLLYLPPEARQEGQKKWRVTHRWHYKPGGWTIECDINVATDHTAAGLSRTFTKCPLGRMDHTVLFTGAEWHGIDATL